VDAVAHGWWDHASGASVASATGRRRWAAIIEVREFWFTAIAAKDPRKAFSWQAVFDSHVVADGVVVVSASGIEVAIAVIQWIFRDRGQNSRTVPGTIDGIAVIAVADDG
jgi:hypothetical protein